ncbi:hypothetical protein KHC28_23345 [Ancylobacter sonchi]|nr:hypothetical protein [Ancylobacter sonchi]
MPVEAFRTAFVAAAEEAGILASPCRPKGLATRF